MLTITAVVISMANELQRLVSNASERCGSSCTTDHFPAIPSWHTRGLALNAPPQAGRIVPATSPRGLHYVTAITHQQQATGLTQTAEITEIRAAGSSAKAAVLEETCGSKSESRMQPLLVDRGEHVDLCSLLHDGHTQAPLSAHDEHTGMSIGRTSRA